MSQNIDCLHLRTGWPRLLLSEVHGNCFVEHCEVCMVDFVREEEICQGREGKGKGGKELFYLILQFCFFKYYFSGNAIYKNKM